MLSVINLQIDIIIGPDARKPNSAAYKHQRHRSACISWSLSVISIVVILSLKSILAKLSTCSVSVTKVVTEAEKNGLSLRCTMYLVGPRTQIFSRRAKYYVLNLIFHKTLGVFFSECIECLLIRHSIHSEKNTPKVSCRIHKHVR